jgi:DnaJ-class molecular chaperone
MTDNKSRSYFQYLGLRPNASEAAVRAAYKVLALQQHPDKADEADRPQATAVFQELQNAYELC